jgi:uncharacterized protein YjiS (DUF1127 family)
MNIKGHVNKWAEVLRKRSNMNATIKEMHMLTDAELNDIGINRSEIENIARGIIDFHRNVRDSDK